ncbi:MAG: AAA family ATPase [Chitinophagales bacterium]
MNPIEIYDYLLKIAQENIIAQGGLVLAIVSGILTAIYQSIKNFYGFIKGRFIRHFKYSVYLDESNQILEAFGKWYFKRYRNKFRDVEAQLIDSEQEDEDAADSYDLMLRQFNDLNWIWYQNRLIFISRDREKLEGALSRHNLYMSQYNIWGFFAEKAINQILEEATKEYNEEQTTPQTEQRIYYNFEDGDFDLKEFAFARFKQFEHLFFDGKDALIKDLDHFIASLKGYEAKRITHNRGYYFYGPPGTGKTSIAFAIAAYLKRDLFIFNANKGMSDKKIIQFFSKVKSYSIILLEDADRFGLEKEDNKFNFSTILNCFDGTFAPTNVIFVMTTNHPDKIDPAMIRDGRFDFKMKIDVPSDKAVCDYLSFHYEETVNIPLGNTLPMSSVQNIVLKNDLATAIEIIKRRSKTSTETNGKMQSINNKSVSLTKSI